jgi:hypothetical protein
MRNFSVSVFFAVADRPGNSLEIKMVKYRHSTGSHFSEFVKEISALLAGYLSEMWVCCCHDSCN